MKALFVLVIALGLSGCGSTDFFGDSASDAPVGPMDEASVPTTTPLPQDASASPVYAPPQQPAPAPVQTAEASAEQTPMAQDTPPPMAHSSAISNEHCTTLARQRAQDAAFEGEDPDTQEAVHDRTYADCMAWDRKHRL